MGLLLTAAPSAQAAGPAVTTAEATEVHFNRATLKGTVNPGGVELEECIFEYGKTEAPYEHTAPCAENPAEIGKGTAAVEVKAEVTGLTAATTYHFRLAAKSPGGTEHGSDRTFETTEAPVLKVTITPNADYVLSGSKFPGVYKTEVENIGSEETSGEITLKDILPAGLSSDHVAIYYSGVKGADFSQFLCPTSTTECKFPGIFGEFHIYEGLKPGEKLFMFVRVPVPSTFEGPLEVVSQVSGGGAPPVESGATNQASPNPGFGLLHFNSSLTDASRVNPYTQAGGHPFQFTTNFSFESYSCANEESQDQGWVESGTCPVNDPKDAVSDLPPGLIINPQGVPHCALAEFWAGECSTKDVVGWAGVQAFGWAEGALRWVSPVFNLQPTGAYPGELGFDVGDTPLVLITSGLRSAGDYGVTASSVAIEASLTRVSLNLWGVPAEAGHDLMRGGTTSNNNNGCFAFGESTGFLSIPGMEENCEAMGISASAEVEPTPFISMPTECSGEPLTISGRYDAWQAQGEFANSSVELPPVDGCNQLSFEPTIESRPTTSLADAPSGLEFNLHIPQSEDAEGVATPALKEAVVKLPPGLTLNPASAEGLGGCTEAQVALHVEEAAHCPDTSKLGSVEVNTRLLAEPLDGFLYLAAPHQNPSHSLIAGYIVLEGQGVRIKLAAHFETDPQTGQITTRFTENPQVPFENLKLHIFGGARGALRTPPVCGNYQTTTSLTPFSAPESGPPAQPGSSFETSATEGGGACPHSAAEEPNAPRFRAGTETPQAGSYSPFAFKLVREDGSQELGSIETTLPPGLLGRLAGIPYCPDTAIAAAAARSGAEEQASPSCPAASELGSVGVKAGAGPTPLDVSGQAYLAGPYRGAPLSVAIVTPALAGPFDLGTVVVRAALYVNPETAQITARSDPIPTILEGIPLDLRSITVKLNRPNFTLNPTNCSELGFSGSALSVLGSAAPLAQRFQVGGCFALPFKPQLSLQLKGATQRAGNPALTATLKMPAGDADVAAAQVTLPPAELLDNAHIGTVCTKPVFAEGAKLGEKCPPASIYGFAKAETPLLEKPLEGPVYLRSPLPGHKLPDLAAALNGQIDVALIGKVDTGKGGGIRNTFEMVPDAPVSKFVLSLDGASKGLLQNSLPLCGGSQHATALFSGQNTKSVESTPLLKVRCAKRHGKRTRNHRGAARRRRAG